MYENIRVPPPPPWGPGPLKNHKATKPAFNVGPTSARQETSFKWRFAGRPLLARL